MSKVTIPWAEVIHVKSDPHRSGIYEVVINRGTSKGVQNGDKLLIFAIGPMMTDPSSGRELGKLEIVRGRATVFHAQEEFSQVRCSERARPTMRKTYSDPLLGFTLHGRTIQEESEGEDLPFKNVEVGDYVKPI